MQTISLLALCQPAPQAAQLAQLAQPEAPTVVLCASARLSASLRQRQAQTMAAQQVARWEPLHTLTVDQWLATLAQDHLLRHPRTTDVLSAQALTPAQQRVAWEHIIQADLQRDDNPFLDTSSLARTAQEAHQLHTLWQVPTGGGSAEQRRFVQWLAPFDALCQRQQWCTPEQQHAAMVQALHRGLHPLPSGLRVVWAGFHRFNPLEQSLQHALQAHAAQGISQWVLEPEAPAHTVQCNRYPDAHHECLAAALWAQAHTAQHPNHRIAIVVPNLAAQRHRLSDILEHVLAPATLRARHAEQPRPYNISLGLPLSDYALVGSALQLIEWAVTHGPLDWTAVSQQLRNPLWSSAQELDARAQLEAHLRRHSPPLVEWPAYAQQLEHAIAHLSLQAPHLHTHIRALQAPPALQGRQLPSAWAAHWWPHVVTLGWLHQHRLSSHDFQIKHAFEQVVQHSARLDALLGPVSAKAYLRELRRLCQDRVFQPQTEGQPAIEVLGLLEASGLRFDAVWVLGLSNNVWPPAARPNPMLGWEAQRHAQSPNASPPVQWAFAQQVHAQLLRAAPHVVLSWPHTDGATQLQPSSLLPPAAIEHGLQTSPHWAHTAVASAPGQHLHAPLLDIQAPPVSPGERVRGGSGLLKAQAICPAWAFVQYRLGASRLDTPAEGMDARQRGSIVHAVLEHFWTHVGSSEALAALSPTALQATIVQAVDHALLDHLSQPYAKALSPRAMQLERNRLLRLTQQWVQTESKRKQAFRVVDCEREVRVSVQGLDIKLILDRIDQLSSGDVVIIDYKTGQTIDTHNWSTDRLTEPQLPLYASIAPPPEGPVAGLVFGKVTLKGPRWYGLTRDNDIVPGAHGLSHRYGRRLFDAARFPGWPQLLAHWQQSLNHVALEVQQGHAAVRVARPADLQYCDVSPVLRLHERQQQWLLQQRPRAESKDA